MYIKELYVMGVVNNKNIKSYFIKNVSSYLDIYNYFTKKYNCEVTLQNKRYILLCNENLEEIINVKDNSLFLYIYLK